MADQRPYRGLTKDGKWVKGWYFHLHNAAMQGDGIKEGDWESCEHDIHGIFGIDSRLLDPVDWEGTIHRASYREVIPETVGQSTGKKDKNSKDSFKDDIAQREPDGPKYLVSWNDIEVGFYLKCLDREYPRQGMSFIEVCEVIGNIHENPDLLKGAKT